MKIRFLPRVWMSFVLTAIFTPLFSQPTGEASNTIEAEALDDQQGLTVTASVFGYFDTGDWAKYSNVDFGDGVTSVDLHLAVDPAFAGKIIELRIDSPTGPLVGRHVVEGTGGWTSYQTQTARVAVSGVHDLYLVGQGGEGIANVDRLTFEASATASGELTPAEPLTKVKLPLEVIGADGYTRAVRFSLEAAPESTVLYLKAHRLAYRDASTNPGRGAKGSVRLNQGAWLDLDNGTVTCYDQEAAYGCLSGAYHTVRLTVPLDGAVAGENTLTFRFNGTDGFTSGYRILEFNVQQGGQNLLPPDTFQPEDPTTWTAPLPASRDVQAGRVLWQEAPLQDYPGGPAIRATCAGCHDQHGRDLEYFAFSNWSIQERAKFHGLDQRQAEQIASYIRSLGAAKGVGRPGRPWNPPYQPGPGLDSKPVEEWAAGAGLAWVLEQDADMLPYLFPQGTSAEAIAEVSTTRGTLNVREMPIALQLPDWQAWLPEVHPVDVWGEAFRDMDPYRAYQETTEKLASGGAQSMRTDPALISSGELIRTLDRFRRAVDDFTGQGGAQPCFGTGVHTSEGFRQLGRPTTPPAAGSSQLKDPNVCELPLRAINHWNAVKHWEVMQEFALEDSPDAVYPYGEPRGWPGTERQVFDLAPHRIGNDSYRFAHLGGPQGAYFNTAWYQLQVTLNAGNRNPRGHRPPDWKYQINHLSHAARDNQDPQPLRYVQTLIKLHQNLDMRTPDGAAPPADYFPYREDRGPTYDGWWLTHVTPWQFVAASASFFVNEKAPFAVWDQLEDVEGGLKNKVQNALLEHWLDKTETYAIAEWPRGQGQNYVNEVDYVPTPYRGGAQIANTSQHADGVYRTIPYLRKDGVREDLIERLRQWGKAIWPAGNWDEMPTLYWESGQRYRIKNRWTGAYIYDDGDRATYGPAAPDDPRAQWQLEDFIHGFYHVKNVATGDYLNIEGGQGYAEATSGGPGWGSALWKLLPLPDPYVQLQCLWPDRPDFLHTQNRLGYVEHGSASPDEWSAQWELILVDDNGSRTVSTTGSSILEEATADLVVYPNPSSGPIKVVGVTGTIVVYDHLGQQVTEAEATHGTATLTIAGPAGLYLIKTGDETRRVLVK